MDLRTLTVHNFYVDARKNYDTDEGRKYFFVKNIPNCDEEAVLKDFNTWKDVNPIAISKSSRMVSVGFKIEDTQLTDPHDLDSFSQRIEELFKWWDAQNTEDKLVGPYLCFVQSSGMGKTKLMFEYKKKMIQDAKETEKKKKAENSQVVAVSQKVRPARKQVVPSKDEIVKALLILPTTQEEGVDGVFDHLLDLNGLIPNAIKDKDTVNNAALDVFMLLEGIISNITGCNKIVLLFDESQILLEKRLGHDAFLFRCVRLWLREKRDAKKIVAVFAGTNSQLANFIVESDSKIEAEKSLTRNTQRFNTEYIDRGTKFNPPFFQTHTIGCLLPSTGMDRAASEYARAVYYGRPLFALMALEKVVDDKISTVLDDNISTVLDRMLLLDKRKEPWKDNRNALINLLATRVQMGQTTMAVTSELVGKAYANLSGFVANTAQLAYLPDPVCARLAMCVMDEDFTYTFPGRKNLPEVEIEGMSKKCWTEKLTEIFSSGVVSPEKGDFGDVMVALYMLFCADLLRKRSNDGNSKNMIQQAYTQFSVSLDEWLQRLQSGGRAPAAALQRAATLPYKSCKVSVGFIQVCRDFVRSYGKSWKSLANQAFLKHVYESGFGFYVYPGCPLIDLVIPLRVEAGTDVVFVPMLVSIKCRLSFSDSEVDEERKKMENKAKTDGLKKGVCLLIVFGSKPTARRNNPPTGIESVSEKLINNVVFKAIFVPHNDIFGLSDAFTAMTPTAQVHAELFASQASIKAHGRESEELNASRAMRSGSSRASLAEYERLREALTKTTGDDEADIKAAPIQEH